WSGQVLPQQSSFGDCVRTANNCHQDCLKPGSPQDCDDACNVDFLTCVGGIDGGNGGDGAGGGSTPATRCGCFPDRTSSTGWKQICCTTVPGSGTQCDSIDECAPEGCGPTAGLPGCTCVCTQKCRSYRVAAGAFGEREIISTQRCQPLGPFPASPA